MSGFATTPNYGLRKPVVGADDNLWGDDWNFNADTLDSLIATLLPKSAGTGQALTGVLQHPPGSAAAPSIIFDPAGTTGIFGGSNTVAMSIMGTARLTVSGSTLSIVANVRTGVGSAAAPVYSFTSDTGLGMYRNASGVLGFAVGGADMLLLSSAGATLAGALALAPPSGDVSLIGNKSASGGSIRIQGQTAGKSRWTINMANATAETGSNAGSDWSLTRSDDTGALIGAAISITRSTGIVDFAVQPTVAGAALSTLYLPLTSGTLTGALTIAVPGAADTNLLLNKSSAARQARIVGQSNGQNRWLMNFGNATSETGGNAGSDFSLNRFDDTGNLLGTVLLIARSTGLATYSGNLTIAAPGSVLTVSPTAAEPNIILNKPTAGIGNRLAGQMNGANRWLFQLGDNSAESGSNAGSNFALNRYDDSGALIGAVISANRATGLLTLGYGLSVTGNVSTTGYISPTNLAGWYLGVSGSNPLINFDNNYYLQFNRSNSSLTYTANAVNVFSIASGGSITTNSSITAGAGLSALGDAAFGMNGDASNRLFQFKSQWFLNFAMNTGDLSWMGSGGTVRFSYRSATDNVMYNNFAPMQGVGAYINSSDERGKTEIGATTIGLAEILGINPIRFRRLSRDRGKPALGRIEIGFSAQNVREHIPEAVLDSRLKPMPGARQIDGSDPKSLLGFQLDPVVAGLVNAIKTLNARLALLEKGS